MKKIFTLATAVFMTIASMAADRRPSVTLQGGKNYDVVIDGKKISASQFGALQLNFLGNGKHTITVYEIPRRFFAIRSKRVVDAEIFMVRGNDIAIKIDQSGQIQVKESKMFNDRDNRGWDDHDNGYGQGQKDQGPKGQGPKDHNDRPNRF